MIVPGAGKRHATGGPWSPWRRAVKGLIAGVPFQNGITPFENQKRSSALWATRSGRKALILKGQLSKFWLSEEFIGKSKSNHLRLIPAKAKPVFL